MSLVVNTLIKWKKLKYLIWYDDLRISNDSIEVRNPTIKLFKKYPTVLLILIDLEIELYLL